MYGKALGFKNQVVEGNRSSPSFKVRSRSERWLGGAFSTNKGKKTIPLSRFPSWVCDSTIASTNRSRLVTSTLGSQNDTGVGELIAFPNQSTAWF